MHSFPHPNATIYTEDMLTDASVANIVASGFTTVIVGLFHVTSGGSLYYNDTPIDNTIISTIKKLKSTKGSSVKTVLFSIGGGNWQGHPASVSDTDYPAMKATWSTPATCYWTKSYIKGKHFGISCCSRPRWTRLRL